MEIINISTTRKRIKSDINTVSNVPVYPFMGPKSTNEMFNPFMGVNPYFNYPFMNTMVNYLFYYVPYQPMMNL